MALRVDVLGPVEARLDGSPLPVPGAKPRAMLTVLGLNPGHAVSAEVLESVLWGEDGPRTARKALRTHISTLRRTLGDGVLTCGEGWELGSVHTDAAEFKAEIERARAAGHERPVTAVEHFDRALALWRGGPSLPGTPRGQAEVTHWSELHAACLDERMDALLAAGHAGDLIGELETAVADQPLRERRWAQLCLALYRAGRLGDALETYQRARSTLVEELGVEPGPELRRLETAMLAQDPTLTGPSARPSGPATASPQPPVPATALVGRRDELDQLLDLFRVRRLVTVTGVGGVGKTRLALAAVEELRSEFQPAWFADLAASEAPHVVEAIGGALGVLEAGRTLPRAVCEHIGSKPALLVLDSCEHVLDAVGPFVEQLLGACPEVRVLVTSRERLGCADEQVLAVPPLPSISEETGGPKGSEAATLFLERVRAIDPDFDADPAEIGEVCVRCDGLPLAIELAAARCPSLGIDGLLAGLDDRLRLLSGSHRRTNRHRSVRAVLDWSHHLLTDREQTLFRRLGTFAGSFDLAAAVAVAAGHLSSSPADVADLVGRLADKHLLVPERHPSGSRWRMLDLVRGYARERLDQAPVDTWVWERYVAWASETAAELERSCEVGGPWRDRFDAVVIDLRAALATAGPDPEPRLVLGLSLATLEARRGAFTAARWASEEAVSIARTTGDAHQLARAALGACISGMLFGVTQERRVELLTEALAALGDHPVPARVRLLARLATELYWSDSRKRSLTLADESVSLAEELDDEGALAHALYARHYVLRSPGTRQERLALAERIVRHARRGGETQLELAGRAAHAIALLESGDLIGTDHEIERLTEAAHRLDHPEFQWYAATYQLVLALVTGRYEDADRLAAEAGDAARREPEFAIGLHFAVAVSDLRHRNPLELAMESERLTALADRFPRVVVWQCLALLNRTATGQPGVDALARRLTDELLVQEPRDAHWLLAAGLLAEALAALPEAPAGLAAALEQELRPYDGELAVGGRVGAFRGSTSHALGLLALARGDADRAVADLERAADQHERIGARPFLERTLSALERARSAAVAAQD